MGASTTSGAPHRLGIAGNFSLPEAQVANASLYGLSVRSVKDGYRLDHHTATGNGKSLEALLPPGHTLKEVYSGEEVGDILAFLYQPFAAITASQPDPGHSRRMLHEVIRFTASGSVDPTQNDKAAHDHGQHGHHDGCEDVADEMLEEAALKRDSEVFGPVLRGFTYSPAKNMFTLALGNELSHHKLTGEARVQLGEAVTQSLHQATGYRYVNKHIHGVSLSAYELSVFGSLMVGRLKAYPELIGQVRAEEKQQALQKQLAKRSKAIEASSDYQALARLKPDFVATVEQRLLALHGASEIVAGMVDNPEMRRIWVKFKFTQELGRVWAKLRGKDWTDESGMKEFSGRLQDLRGAIGTALSGGAVGLERAEAIVAEFRDIIAASRHFISILDQSIEKAQGRDAVLEAQRAQLKLLDGMFESASIAPVSLAPEYLEGDVWDVSHYLARHTGVEGVHYGRAFKDFVDDFGGEVMEFVQKNPALTAMSAVALYMMISNNGGGSQAINVAPEYAGAASAVDPLTGLPLAAAVPAGDVGQVVCHWHTPPAIKNIMPLELARALKLEHCLVSNQWALQLQDTYALMKGPLSMILAAPDQAADALTALRGADAPAFAFAGSFHQSMKFFGDAYFVANGYQNLAHAPWFGIAFAMGWKLGLKESLIKTSGLLSPLVDALAALARTHPFVLPVAVAAASYGYHQNSLSGAIAGSVMGSFAGWGVQNTAELLQKIPELEALKASGTLQSLAPSQRAVTRAEDLISQGCPEGLAQTIGALLKAAQTPGPAADEPVVTLPQTRRRILPVVVGGAIVRSVLDANTHAALLKGLHGFSYILDCAPEKMGLEDEGDEAYRLHLQKCLRTVTVALEDYANEDLHNSGLRSALPRILRRKLSMIIGAELKHFGTSHIYAALNAGELTRAQKNVLGAQASRLQRRMQRDNAQAQDGKTLRQLCETMGESLRNIALHPVLVPLSIAYKGGVAGKTILKMSLRETWYRTLQTLSRTAQQAGRLPPAMKGHLIGGGLTLAAVSTGIDFSPAAQDALAAAPNLKDLAHTISSASGHAAGATTATGLFAVYNFAEDHLVIHVGLGFLFIGAAAGIKLVVRPAQKLGKTFLTPALDMAEDIGLPARAPARAFKAAVQTLKQYGQDIAHYDERYLDRPALDRH
jgi:hypothetical protein